MLSGLRRPTIKSGIAKHSKGNRQIERHSKGLDFKEGLEKSLI
nr:MAG TPA: hypothetical protein [Caudoviricetes sp.]